MIQTETYEKNGRTLARTYSDAGYRIRQDGTGAVYDEAVDPVEMGRTYTETDEQRPDAELAAQEALDIITGVAQ
ncbi:MAG TPA: hypothetical protein H9839_01725 [Candidatus Intestinimonas stercorigallinarum]|nr:hypothetical protein [Candidatus Intestinimonas stercorigallinarum]